MAGGPNPAVLVLGPLSLVLPRSRIDGPEGGRDVERAPPRSASLPCEQNQGKDPSRRPDALPASPVRMRERAGLVDFSRSGRTGFAHDDRLRPATGRAARRDEAGDLGAAAADPRRTRRRSGPRRGHPRRQARAVAGGGRSRARTGRCAARGAIAPGQPRRRPEPSGPPAQRAPRPPGPGRRARTAPCCGATPRCGCSSRRTWR